MDAWVLMYFEPMAGRWVLVEGEYDTREQAEAARVEMEDANEHEYIKTMRRCVNDYDAVDDPMLVRFLIAVKAQEKGVRAS